MTDEMLRLEKEHEATKAKLEAERDEAMKAAGQSPKRDFDAFMLEHRD